MKKMEQREAIVRRVTQSILDESPMLVHFRDYQIVLPLEGPPFYMPRHYGSKLPSWELQNSGYEELSGLIGTGKRGLAR